jgi:phospholipid/cholesterol/gamma-HCH transport system substrate-binding protein
MSGKSHAGKVGAFVFIGLVLIGALMLNFSQGLGLLQPKYELKLNVRSVAGLKPRSSVTMAGIEVGKVEEVQFNSQSQGALVRLSILKKYRLPVDSRFVIEQQNVLGDVAVTIKPGSPERGFLQEGAEVEGDQPFNLQEVAQSANALMRRFEQLGSTVEKAIVRLNEQVLDAQTLSNLSRTIGNMQALSDHAVGLIDNASGVISNAGPVLTLSLTNLYEFSRKLDKVAMEVEETIVTNRVELNEAMKNLRDATASLRQMTADMQSGKGLAGGLLKDEQLRAQVYATVTNLANLSSNLNRYGLLYKPKEPKRSSAPAYSGKSEFK